MILSKNKNGYNFIATLNRTLKPNRNNKNTFAMHAAMIFPHLLLCKTKSEIDGSLSKTIARRLKQWQDGDLDGLNNEGKALQMRLLKGSRRRTIYSREGTTQGDPLAMDMYGLAIIPLIKLLTVDNVTQKWYADDGNAVGKLSNLRTVLDKIVSLGKFFGYHVKASKCQLIVKDEKLGKARKIFANTGITIKAGARVLGSVIRTDTECKKIFEFQQIEQIKILKKLTKITKTSPQNVYACYTKEVQEKLLFIARRMRNTMENLEICENIIKEQLLPNLVGKDTLNHQFREISSLLLKMRGLKLPSNHKSYLEWSKETSLVLEYQDPITAVTQQEKICTKIKKLKTDLINRKKNKPH